MKRSVLIILIILLAVSTACEQTEQSDTLPTAIIEQTSLPSVEPVPTGTPVATPILTEDVTPEPTVMPMDWPELEWYEPGEYIPNRIRDEEYTSNSNDVLQEDEAYIYYWRYHNGLFYIRKSNGDVKKITTDCWNFTVCNGKIYYVDRDGDGNVNNSFKIIEMFDIKTGSNETLLRMDKEVQDLACNSDKIYYTCAPNLNEQGCVLYAANHDGNNTDKLGDDVDTFCLYKNKVYMVTTGDLGFINEYDIDSKEWNKLYDGAVSYDFDFSLNRMICFEHKTTRFKVSDILIYNVNTGDTKEYPPSLSFSVVAGQYIVLYERDEGGNFILKAYDFLADKGYILLDFSHLVDEEDLISIHATRDNIYLCLNNDEELEMYRIIIEDGQASIECVATIEDDD